MILYYSTVTRELYKTATDAVSAENAKIEQNKQKVKELDDLMNEYYREIEDVRARYDSRLSKVLEKIFKSTRGD